MVKILFIRPYCRNLTPKNPFFSRASVSQQDNRNPRAKALWEKWRHVWMMAWERDRRLKEKLNYLHELEKVKNFDWDDWRKRFLKHHNNKKSRVTDLFRKLDEDGDGYLSRDDFIEGILKNKFLSSRLEMNAVADKFDHGDGELKIFISDFKKVKVYLFRQFFKVFLKSLTLYVQSSLVIVDL